MEKTLHLAIRTGEQEVFRRQSDGAAALGTGLFNKDIHSRQIIKAVAPIAYGMRGGDAEMDKGEST
ncbi:MAG: hypothetical protein D3906_05925 [Candidatus Electrothrix sp. AUS1_2]|nr:hypothetical protein [Candidatus Electrothrix sp. AUS1_2]